MQLKTSPKIAKLVKRTVAHYLKTKEYCLELYKEAVTHLYGRGPWNLTYLQAKSLHDQLRTLLVNGGFLNNTAKAYLRACNRAVLFGASFDFARSGSLQDIERLQEIVKSYSDGTPQERYDRAVKEILQEKRQDTHAGEPAFKVRSVRDGEPIGEYIQLVEAELSKALQQPVTIQLKTKGRQPA